MTVSSKNPPGGERRKTFSVNVCILLSGYNKRNLIARNIRSPQELSMTPRMGSESGLDEACSHRAWRSRSAIVWKLFPNRKSKCSQLMKKLSVSPFSSPGLTSGNMPRGLPRGTARRGIQGGMPPWLQGAVHAPAREREAGSEATVGRGKREAGSPSKLTWAPPSFIKGRSWTNVFAPAQL